MTYEEKVKRFLYAPWDISRISVVGLPEKKQKEL